ncbi:MAG: amino acid racemase [Deltaproteobacteria bacterium]|nr:amino acid racemase [Deltaproteobacteria bacterium]
MNEGIIGILGGMGPEATAFVFKEIIKNTEAARDQDHIRVVVDNNPKIPERVPAILGRGEDPLPMMIETARNLERAGADFIVIPCVTAHYFIGELKEGVAIPVISIIEEVVEELERRLPDIERTGLIATTGTIQARLFQSRLSVKDIEVIVPSPEEQEHLVMSSIYGESGIKAGYTSGENRRNILKVSKALISRGAQAVIGGCTEIPLVLKDGDLEVPFLDSLSILAVAAIQRAKGSTR